MPSDVLRERAKELTLPFTTTQALEDAINAELERVVRECAEEVHFHGYARDARVGILKRFGLDDPAPTP